jgi:hypothetical protein
MTCKAILLVIHASVELTFYGEHPVARADKTVNVPGRYRTSGGSRS